MTAQLRLIPLLLTAGVLLMACGKSDAPPPPASADASKAANAVDAPTAAPGMASAGRAAAAPDCAGTPNGQQDLLGIAVGDDQPTARARLLCGNPYFQIATETSDYRLDGVLMSRVTLVADTGLDKVTVNLAGAPGAERVIGVSRSMEFTDEKRPTMEALRASFAEKYGQLDYASEVTLVREGNKYVNKLIEDKNLPRVIFSVDGQRLNWRGNIYHNCNYGVRDIANSRTSFPTVPVGCGFGFTADMRPLNENPLMVGEITMAISNLAAARNLLAEEATRAKGELAQQRAAENLRNAEAAKAADNRAAPKL